MGSCDGGRIEGINCLGSGCLQLVSRWEVSQGSAAAWIPAGPLVFGLKAVLMIPTDRSHKVPGICPNWHPPNL